MMRHSGVGAIFSSVPSDNEIQKLEQDLGISIKKIEKRNCAIFYFGKGPFKKKIVVPKNSKPLSNQPTDRLIP